MASGLGFTIDGGRETLSCVAEAKVDATEPERFYYACEFT